jgi:hypothetical protein
MHKDIHTSQKQNPPIASGGFYLLQNVVNLVLLLLLPLLLLFLRLLICRSVLLRLRAEFTCGFILCFGHTRLLLLLLLAVRPLGLVLLLIQALTPPFCSRLV